MEQLYRYTAIVQVKDVVKSFPIFIDRCVLDKEITKKYVCDDAKYFVVEELNRIDGVKVLAIIPVFEIVNCLG
ncbi:MAG: hypothetical protein E6X82_03510 [Clostridium sp.]|nr:hypothetical protein [Clostridium sp.]